MDHEVALLGTAKVALQTSVRFLSSMSPDVLPKVLFLRGSEWTVRTCVRFFTRVDAGMFCKVRGNGRFVRADAALKYLGGNAGTAGIAVRFCPGDVPPSTSTIVTQPHL